VCWSMLRHVQIGSQQASRSPYWIRSGARWLRTSSPIATFLHFLALPAMGMRYAVPTSSALPRNSRLWEKCARAAISPPASFNLQPAKRSPS
jgi:hypothetical protein